MFPPSHNFLLSENLNKTHNFSPFKFCLYAKNMINNDDNIYKNEAQQTDKRTLINIK